MIRSPNPCHFTSNGILKTAHILDSVLEQRVVMCLPWRPRIFVARLRTDRMRMKHPVVDVIRGELALGDVVDDEPGPVPALAEVRVQILLDRGLRRQQYVAVVGG